MTAAGQLPTARLLALLHHLRTAAGEVEILLGSAGSGLATSGESRPCVVTGEEPASAMIPTTKPTVPAPEAALMTAKQVAQHLGCDQRTARRWRQTRGFPAPIKVGRSRRWRRRDVERWIEERGR